MGNKSICRKGNLQEPAESNQESAQTATGAAVASESKGILDLGAGLLRRSLESAIGPGKSVYENLSGKEEVAIEPGTPPAPEIQQPAGPDLARALDLAKVDTSSSESR